MAQTLPLRPGANSIAVRGVPQAVYSYPGGAGSARRPCVVFAPGDGGWRGFAITVAEQVAAWGYDVYGLDTKHYLESSSGKTPLKEADVMADIRQLAEAACGKRRAVLLGWSEGAGLMTLAAASASKEAFAGLITMGLPDRNVLAWKFSDNLAHLTGRKPSGPAFFAVAYLPRVAPLPVFMLQSSKDEYVGRDEANRLFNAASQPKRFVAVDARNHRFDGAQPEFFRQLRQALEWTIAAGPKPAS